MKTAFLFAGQGQQYHGMGVDLYHKFEIVKEIYDKAHEVLGYNLLEIDEEKLSDSMYIQPSLYVLNHALSLILKEKGIVAHVVCGLSLGEYNALTYASVVSFEVGLNIIKKRAEIMSRAFIPGDTKMAACLKTDTDTLVLALRDSNVEICNYNSPTNHVIGGYTKDVDNVLPILKTNKILAIPLKMSTVSHMSLMDKASNQLRGVLETYEFQFPTISFLNNIEGTYQNQNFVDSLSLQISKPTQMSKIIERLYQDGVQHFIEIGPKGSLSRLVKEICPNDTLIQNVYNTKTLEEVNHG